LDRIIPVSIPPTFMAVSRYSVYRYTGIGSPTHMGSQAGLEFKTGLEMAFNVKNSRKVLELYF